MFVQVTERCGKSMEQLRRGDGRAAMAARTAEGIIRALSDGDVAAVNHKLTCHGEARLEKAVKFDLGAGYRMVSVRSGDALLMLFAGSHDDCDRWLERHRGESFVFDTRLAEVASDRSPALLSTSEVTPAMEEPEEYAEELSQRDLRLVFRGLCGR